MSEPLRRQWPSEPLSPADAYRCGVESAERALGQRNPGRERLEKSAAALERSIAADRDRQAYWTAKAEEAQGRLDVIQARLDDMTELD